MQIQVQRLRETLDLLGPAVPKKPTLKVLANLLLKDGQAMATDLDVAVALDLPEVEGECVIPFRPAAELLKRVPWNEMLTLEQKGKAVELTWSGGKASYQAVEPEDYPPLPGVEARVEQAVDGDTLVPALLTMADYCATDTERPVLAGVTLMLGETIEVVGADGYKLAHQALPMSFPAEVDMVIIPASAIRVLGHLWSKTARVSPMADSFVGLLTARRRLELALGDTMLKARFGAVTLIAKLIQGTPPNYRQLIPEDTPSKVQVFAPDLERAVRQVREVARDGSGTVRLTWSETEMTVSARSEDKGEAEATISVEASGDGRVALNVSYLLDYLRGKEGLVSLGVRSGQEPILFQHSASPLVLIMPMFVQW